MLVPGAQLHQHPGHETIGLQDRLCLHPVSTVPDSNVAKVWWEQWVVPRWSLRVRADLIWNPYWTAPLWQPCPVTVTIHDLIPVLLPEYRVRLKQKLYQGLLRYATARIRHAITVSQAAHCDIKSHLVLEAETAVVYNGINVPPGCRQETGRAALRARLSLPDRYYLYLGGFERRKNVAAVLRAFRRFQQLGGDPGIKLVLAGKLPDADTQVLQQPQPLIQALGLENDVLCVGYVDEVAKTVLYKTAIAYVFPSLYEGFGLTPIEAMQAGTPVITSRI